MSELTKRTKESYELVKSAITVFNNWHYDGEKNGLKFSINGRNFRIVSDLTFRGCGMKSYREFDRSKKVAIIECEDTDLDLTNSFTFYDSLSGRGSRITRFTSETKKSFKDDGLLLDTIITSFLIDIEEFKFV